MRPTAMAAVLAIVVGAPLGWILMFMATPLLWRLEPILNVELAGHSGPSDWVFYVGWAILVPLLFWFLRKLLKPKSASNDISIMP